MSDWGMAISLPRRGKAELSLWSMHFSPGSRSSSYSHRDHILNDTSRIFSSPQVISVRLYKNGISSIRYVLQCTQQRAVPSINQIVQIRSYERRAFVPVCTFTTISWIESVRSIESGPRDVPAASRDKSGCTFSILWSPTGPQCRGKGARS
jgi:hypothetical protein